MPNVPLARELEALAPAFAAQLAGPVGDITGPKLVPREAPELMYANVDTRIFVRARPILSHEPDRVTTVRCQHGMRNCVFMSPEVTVAGKTSIVPTSIPVDATFVDTDSNEEVYATTCCGLLPLAARGGSAALLCYGQTGSGKTFTTTGMLRCVARDMAPVFEDPANHVTVAFIEVRAEGCRDLISGDVTVQIVEDKSGAVQVMNVLENPVTSVQQVMELCSSAIAARSTKTTERNQSGSSRSHMAARFLFRRKDTPWVAPGVLCFVDLAGSESAADAVGHDKERIAETRFINSSLMTLKECIRARGEASITTKHVHVPFRQSKLTLLLRDSFELVVQRQTKTAMIACVSPLLRDARHTYNTLRYAALLYVSPKAGVVIEASKNDPSTWSRDDALMFIRQASNGRIKNPELILNAGDGRALAALPEADFIDRATKLCGLGPKAAEEVYGKVWKAVIDAKKHLRVAMKKAKDDAIAKREESRARLAAAPAAARGGVAGRPPAVFDDELEVIEMDPRPQPVPAAIPPRRSAGPAAAQGVCAVAATPASAVPRRPAAVLLDEKENEDFLFDLTRRMAAGHPSRR